MRTPKGAKVAEAIARMRLLGISSRTIHSFEHGGKISVHEPPIGALFFLEDSDMVAIHDFEQAYNAVVYSVVRTYTTMGVMDAYLYVSDYEDGWEYERSVINDRMVSAYVINRENPRHGDFGSIGINSLASGGLVRTW